MMAILARYIEQYIHQSTQDGFRFVAAPSSTREEISGEMGIVGSVAITNKSSDVACECELVILSCSPAIPNLTPNIALPVKNRVGKTKTNIGAGETKYFDLFGTFLTVATDWPERTFVWSPKTPYLPVMGPIRCAAVFKLSGSNFATRIWHGSISINDGDARLTRLEPAHFSSPPQSR